MSKKQDTGSVPGCSAKVFTAFQGMEIYSRNGFNSFLETASGCVSVQQILQPTVCLTRFSIGQDFLLFQDKDLKQAHL